MNLNTAQIVGRLTRDPEFKALESGTNVTTFSLATSEKYKNKAGELVENTEYHNIVVFGGQAAPCADFLKKGSLALVIGKLKTRSWEKDGVKHYRTEIVASDVVFGPLSSQPKTAESKTTADRPDYYPDSEINPDEIPF